MAVGNLLYWALIFLVVAVIAGFLGFGGAAGAAAGAAHLVFYVAIVLLLDLACHEFRKTLMHQRASGTSRRAFALLLR